MLEKKPEAPNGFAAFGELLDFKRTPILEVARVLRISVGECCEVLWMDKTQEAHQLVQQVLYPRGVRTGAGLCPQYPYRMSKEY